MKSLFLVIVLLFTPLIAYGQCELGSVCVRQSTIDAATKAAVELVEAREVIAKFTAERTATQAERESAARLIDRLNSVIAIQDRLVKDYENVIKLYKETLQMYAELVEKMGKQLSAPKSPWAKFASALKAIANVALGIVIGRGI